MADSKLCDILFVRSHEARPSSVPPKLELREGQSTLLSPYDLRHCSCLIRIPEVDPWGRSIPHIEPGSIPVCLSQSRLSLPACHGRRAYSKATERRRRRCGDGSELRRWCDRRCRRRYWQWVYIGRATTLFSVN